MRITLYAVGGNKFSFLREGEGEYLRRLAHYTDIRIVQAREERHSAAMPQDAVVQKEWESIRKALPESCHLIVLDKRGKTLSSEALAEKIGDLRIRRVPEVCFAVGGSLGLPDAALKQADFTLSLSAMTFTHDMSRLILLEQLYRSFTILRGEKYHK